ncbi:MAG TPA: stage II sporulation protein M [Ignavibacteria bacterium]|nr:stage II sporulation protein M [Ignavibacteria bacterium]
MKLKTISKNYSLCWKFLNESRWYIVFSVGIFALMFLIGFAFPFFFREEIFTFISEMSGMIEGKSLIELIGFIFLNNIKASFMAIILGITFGLFPLIVGVINGYLLGFVAREVATQEGILVLWRLFPHGIFELPAIILSIGIGIKIGADLFKKDTKKMLKYNFKEGLRFFVFVIFPLILIAGIIESFLIYFLR